MQVKAELYKSKNTDFTQSILFFMISACNK